MRHTMSLLAILLASIAMGAPTSPDVQPSFHSNGPDPGMVPYNTTMPDGTVQTVWLHKNFSPVDQSSAPSTAPDLERRIVFHGGSDTNKCGESTFIDKTTLGSANQIDCSAVINQMKGGPGWFAIFQGADLPDNKDWCRVAYHDTCVFGIHTTDFFGTYIGTQDITDIITVAMQKRAGDPRVQFEGDMHCDNNQGPGKHSNVQWAIFKPL
ncbi:uncharacterized protein JN550_006418 [Neoarthrinium moseri]|uniref:uncharacterized protein n=1 Tax=Neoarthrinium moseri TaxID=1658444 RepID=UPI001FDB27D4|nr:uncharacterized protein JN550_006418 [Neoarthrinium moseri]KAI1868502.1 hypothetical protein JN550_006418 [Neoarthrinium moseri]